MSEEVYTLAAWRVKDGRQSEFVEAWKELGSSSRGTARSSRRGDVASESRRATAVLLLRAVADAR